MSYRYIDWELWNKRNYKHGGDKQTHPLQSLTLKQIERYLARVNRDFDCWIFISKTKERYPRYLGYLAHRIAYELYKGAIAEGLTIDHLCCNTWCQNPDHLETVTALVNSKRYSAQKRKKLIYPQRLQ